MVQRTVEPRAEGFTVLRLLRSRHTLALCGYLLVALYLISSVLSSFSTRFVGGGTGDVYEMARHVWWYKTALESGDDVFYQSLLAYPDGFPSVVLWANPLQFFPMWLFAFVMPLAMAYNLGILITLTLNGWAMYIFARQRISSLRLAPAWIAGLVYMVFPIMQGHLFDGHAGLIVQWTAPILLLSLFKHVDAGRKRWFALAVIFFLLSALGHSLQFLYFHAPLFALFTLARVYRRDYVGATRTIAVALVGTILLLGFLSPVIERTLQSPHYEEAGGYVRYSIDLLGLVSPSFENPFWRDIAPHSGRVLGTNLGEGASYIGFVSGILALVGLLFRRQTRWWLLVAAASWLLALGPVLKILDEAVSVSVAGYSTVIPLPYAFLMNLPFVELARTPGRFMFLFSAALSMMAGWGMLVLWRGPLFQRRSRLIRNGMALLLALLIFHDYQLFAAFPSIPAGIPQGIHDLAKRNDIRAVYNVPHDHLLSVKEAMYLQTAHGKPLVAGQETRVTPVDPARLVLLSSFHPLVLAEARADAVIINKARALESGQFNTLYPLALERLGAPIFEDERYAVFESRSLRRSTTQEPVYSLVSDAGSHNVYTFKARPGWLTFRATLTAVNRRVNLSLNDVPLQTVNVVGQTELSIPLPIARRGYNTLRIALDPPCPDRVDTTVLLCHDVAIGDVQIEQLTDGAIYDPIRVAGGIELSGYYMPEDIAEELVIHLWWSFDAPRTINDQRFIHVLNEERVLMRQDDSPPGDVQAGSGYLETVRLDVGGFEPGEYRVLTGWYALPDMVRYDVLTNVAGAQDSTIELGRFSVAE